MVARAGTQKSTIRTVGPGTRELDGTARLPPAIQYFSIPYGRSDGMSVPFKTSRGFIPARRTPVFNWKLPPTAVLILVFARSAVSSPYISTRFHDHNRPRISEKRTILSQIPRWEFMTRYDTSMQVRLAGAGIYRGYHGQNLADDPVLTRYEIAALLGRFIRLVNSRDGKVFAGRRVLEKHMLWIPRPGWGLFDVEASLAEGFTRPRREAEYWNQPLARYSLAVFLDVILKTLAQHYEPRLYFEVYPPVRIHDFVVYGHPYWFLCRRSIQFGILDIQDGLFHGRDPVRGHSLCQVLERLVTLVNGYSRDGDPRPWNLEGLVDSSSLALEAAGPFPADLKTIERRFIRPTALPRARDDGILIPRQRTLDSWAPETVDRPR